MHFPARHIVRDDVVDPRFITNSDSPYKIAQKHSHKHGTELTFTADHIVSHIETRRASTTETTLPVFLTVMQIGVVVTRTIPSIMRKFLVRIHSVLDLPRQYLELTSSKKRTLQKWERCEDIVPELASLSSIHFSLIKVTN